MRYQPTYYLLLGVMQSLQRVTRSRFAVSVDFLMAEEWRRACETIYIQLLKMARTYTRSPLLFLNNRVATMERQMRQKY